MPFPPRSGPRQGLPGLRRLIAASTMLGLVVAGAMPSVGVGELDLVPTTQTNPNAGVVSSDVEVPGIVPAVAAERRGGQRGAEMRGSAEAGQPGDVVAAVTREETAEFGMVGVTWDAGTAPADLVVELRTKVDGAWGDWDELEVEDTVDQGMAAPREGTSPIWTGMAEGADVRLRSAGSAPEDVELTLIDGGTGLAVEPTGDAALTSTTTTSSGTLVPRPQLRSRAQWGVDSSTEDSCSSPTTASSSRGVTLHHTAGSNGYTKEQAPGIMRGMHRYHTASLNWCDIGYNFVVDAYGVIYVGRRGGPDKQVRGAHAGNHEANTYFTGVSMMGNYETTRPSAAMKSSVVKLIAWRLNRFNRNPHGTSPLGGTRIPVIHGHRDIRLKGIYPSTATACPGRYGVEWLDSTLRDEVAAEIAAAPADPSLEREAEPERVPSTIRGLVRPRRTLVAGQTHVRIRARVRVNGDPAPGRVVVRYKGKRLDVQRLEDGSALLRIGRFTYPKTHQVRLIHLRTRISERTVKLVDVKVERG